MIRIIKTVSGAHKEKSLDFVEKVFTGHENAAEGRVVRNLVEELRA